MRHIIVKSIDYLVGMPFLVLFCYIIGPIIGLALGFSGLLALTLLAGRKGIKAFYRGMILGIGSDGLPASDRQVQEQKLTSSQDRPVT
ncbi:hypothetical protein [Vreelandella venusta]|uniref:Uncharacterized protein n=1 Tax=Vreelandella venusta TaxID=44935 RepID=A0ABX2B5F1_9GAMM|nr:hypothetical protein [Halomonas venusta]AZM94749.1 hypothetical protein EI420_03195 [Halomonas venusta]NPT29242.1 hypothetical protein [Halomonas venusta]